MSRFRSREAAVWLVLFALMSAVSWADPISVGQKVPNFTLLNQDGKKVSLSDYQGKVIMVTFLYTRCPFPEKCPMISEKLGQTRALMQKLNASDKFQVLSITIDPKYDTPERLKAYTQGNDKDFGNWDFLTGTPEQIANVAGLFGLVYWEENGVIEHNMRTGIIDPKGYLAKVVRGSEWKAGELSAIIKDILPK